MIKASLFLLIFASTAISQAMPVLNENVAAGGIVTIFPDHADPHRYYIAPTAVGVASSESGKALFTYVEYKKAFLSKVGMITMVLGAAYTQTDLELAKAKILEKDPDAQFAGVPFLHSSLKMTGELPDLIRTNQCTHDAGLIGQEQSCSMELTPKGRIVFLSALRKKALFLTLQFEYSLMGVVKRADNSFLDQTVRYGVAAKIDSGQLLARKATIIRRF